VANGRRFSSGFSRGTRGFRRKTAWEEGPGGTTKTAISAGGVSIIGLGAAAAVEGLTLIRLRGKFRHNIQSSTAAGDGLVGAFGINIVKAPAFAIGVTAVPTPIAEQDNEDWLYWMPIQLVSSFATEGFGNAGSDLEDHVIDTKAMRKLQVGDTIYAATELVLTGTASTVLTFDSRILAKLA